MKRLVLVALAFLFLARPAAADGFFASDKISHFGVNVGVGFATGTLVYHYSDKMGPVGKMGPLGRTLTSTAIGTVPGLIVEIVDSATGHGFSAGDLGADVLGALTGAISAELFNGQFFVSASDRQIKLVMRW
jgi:putative lipoprotein